jgi:hypothetical protein
MNALLQLMIAITLGKKGPQDIPYSPPLLLIVLAVYLLTGLTITTLQSPWHEAIIQVLVEALMLAAFAGALLVIHKKRARLVQTLSALFGTDVVLTLPSIPLLVWLQQYPEAHGAFLALFTLMLWHVLVVGHILRHALSTNAIVGMVWSFCYTFINFQLMMNWFPGE